MVSKGWGHQSLLDMSEPDFAFWRDETLEVEQLKTDAIEKALEE
jgi:hypothetical protein